MIISERIRNIAKDAEREMRDIFADIDRIAEENTERVLDAFREAQISESHFTPSTGYGYGDRGRDAIDAVAARIFRAEAGFMRSSIISGTHALTVGLFGLLRPNDTLLSVTGKPYDTLEEVIGIRESACSLKEYGVSYRQTDLLPDGGFDYEAIKNAVNEKTKLATIQRSKGYRMRPTFSVAQIGELTAFLKSLKPDIIVMVDNCYGEFTEKTEPSDAGADLVVGSLIKNPGGGLAPIGGYIAGRRDLIDRCHYRLTAPGIGQDVGASMDLNRSLYQGFFLSPTVTAAALKGAVFAANLYERLGFPCLPRGDEPRHDVIQSIALGSPEAMIAFAEGIQAAAPVDSYVAPVPSPIPGYADEVIMAAGAFIQGASIELSADGPIRPPYAIYFQGGLTWPHAKLGILLSLQKLIDKGLVTL